MDQTFVQILLSFVAGILTFGGIAGVIALMITAVLCIRFLIRGPEEIPEVLKYALTTIIGFYFGTATPGKAVVPPTPPAITAPAPSP